MHNSKNKKRIFICGGAGFIGQTLTKELLKEGRNINLLIYDKTPPPFKNKNLSFLKGSILDKKALKRALKKSDIVINLVGSFRKDFYLINVLGSSNLLEVCKESDIKKIIFISSEAVYGEYTGKPHIESDCPKPITEYGFSKYMAEKIYKFYSDKYKIPIIILRLSSTYGPGQKIGIGVLSDSLNSALKKRPLKIHGDGEQHRDFLYIDDAVKGIIKSIYYETKGLEIFNIPGKKSYSLLELTSLIKKKIGNKIEIKFLEPRKQDIKRMYSNYSKAKRLLNYEPKVSLREGITRTIDYYKNIKS
ncbi:MAG: NAD-dependent epimerase/dehydratase family protein [Candidatus Nealsonbacteria bacterium]|nr:NAD-dependent epimerase/dehydratase family protein [Candidatus Nealsonbacteria bacterium]